MKSRIAVSILSLSVAVLSLMLGGCSGGGNIESNFSSGAVQSAVNSNSSSGESVPLDEPPVESTPSTPSGEPTFLTAPDGTPIYTSEISEVYTGEEELDNIKPITFAEAEQIAQTGDGKFTVKCDGFVYGYIRQRAVNRIDDPEMFEDSGDGKYFKYLGELSDEKSGYNMQVPDFIRIKPGDKFGELTVKNAYMLFTGNQKYANTPYVPGAHISGGCIEFDGAIELDGYICVTPTDTLYGEGGDMTFFPNGDSSTKLPSVSPFWNEEDGKYYAITRSDYHGYHGNLELDIGNMYKVDCDTSGLHPGDSMVKAKISLENIRYVPGFMGGWKLDLKSIEVI